MWARGISSQLKQVADALVKPKYRNISQLDEAVKQMDNEKIPEGWKPEKKKKTGKPK